MGLWKNQKYLQRVHAYQLIIGIGRLQKDENNLREVIWSDTFMLKCTELDTKRGKTIIQNDLNLQKSRI